MRLLQNQQYPPFQSNFFQNKSNFQNQNYSDYPQINNQENNQENDKFYNNYQQNKPRPNLVDNEKFYNQNNNDEKPKPVESFENYNPEEIKPFINKYKPEEQNIDKDLENLKSLNDDINNFEKLEKNFYSNDDDETQTSNSKLDNNDEEKDLKTEKESSSNLTKSESKKNLNNEKESNKKLELNEDKEINDKKKTENHSLKHKHHKHHEKNQTKNDKEKKDEDKNDNNKTNDNKIDDEKFDLNEHKILPKKKDDFFHALNNTTLNNMQKNTNIKNDESVEINSDNAISKDENEEYEKKPEIPLVTNSEDESLDNKSSENIVQDDNHPKSDTIRNIKNKSLTFTSKLDNLDEPKKDVLDLIIKNGDKYKQIPNQILKDYESDAFIKYLIKNKFIDESDLTRSTNQDGYFEIPFRINDEVFILARRKWLAPSKSNGVLLTLFLPISACFFLAILIYLYINDRLIHKMNKGLQELMKIENQSGKMFEFKMIENYEYIHVNVNMSYFNHNFNSNISRMPYNNILMSGGTANFKGDAGSSQIMDSIDVSAITLQLDDDMHLPINHKPIENKTKKNYLMKRKRNIIKKRKLNSLMKKNMVKYSQNIPKLELDTSNPILRSSSSNENNKGKIDNSIYEVKVCFDNDDEKKDQNILEENPRKNYIPLENMGETKIQMSSYGNLENNEKEKDLNKIYEI